MKFFKGFLIYFRIWETLFNPNTNYADISQFIQERATEQGIIYSLPGEGTPRSAEYLIKYSLINKS